MRGNAKSPVIRNERETKKEERKELKKPAGKVAKESRRNSGVENNGKKMKEAKDERGRRVR